MSLRRFLHGLEHALVYTEAGGSYKHHEGCVGHHADQTEDGEGEKNHQDAAEYDPRPLRVPPVHQRLH